MSLKLFSSMRPWKSLLICHAQSKFICYLLFSSPLVFAFFTPGRPIRHKQLQRSCCQNDIKSLFLFFSFLKGHYGSEIDGTLYSRQTSLCPWSYFLRCIHGSQNLFAIHHFSLLEFALFAPGQPYRLVTKYLSSPWNLLSLLHLSDPTLSLTNIYGLRWNFALSRPGRPYPLVTQFLSNARVSK